MVSLNEHTGNHLFSNVDNNPQTRKFYYYTVDYILVGYVFNLIAQEGTRQDAEDFAKTVGHERTTKPSWFLKRICSTTSTN